MQDLEVIQRLNAEATAAEIPKLQAEGKFVVCVYVGLNYFSHEGFGSESEAQAYIDKRTEANTPGERTQLLPPTVPAEVETPVEGGAPVIPASQLGLIGNPEAKPVSTPSAAADDVKASGTATQPAAVTTNEVKTSK